MIISTKRSLKLNSANLAAFGTKLVSVIPGTVLTSRIYRIPSFFDLMRSTLPHPEQPKDLNALRHISDSFFVSVEDKFAGIYFVPIPSYLAEKS